MVVPALPFPPCTSLGQLYNFCDSGFSSAEWVSKQSFMSRGCHEDLGWGAFGLAPGTLQALRGREEAKYFSSATEFPAQCRMIFHFHRCT